MNFKQTLRFSFNIIENTVTVSSKLLNKLLGYNEKAVVRYLRNNITDLLFYFIREECNVVYYKYFIYSFLGGNLDIFMKSMKCDNKYYIKFKVDFKK